ncbi:MAG TPA: hypothetical protein VN673_02560, partial [Clostridia bacterium]|nr:hypothetical protein [Clostridia bacterium]
MVHIPPTVLLQPCGSDCATVLWKQANFEEEEGYQNLPPIGEQLATNQAKLDRACVAALAGPIHFPLAAKDGSSMLLGHLGSLKDLSQALAAKAIFELREKRYGESWTNLLALTRLNTAWDPESVEISHLVRFNIARSAYYTAWQALQTHHWTEAQLVALQKEWEAPDFFKGIPDTIAFMRACAVDTCIQERSAPQPGIPLQNTLENALQFPGSLPADLKRRWERARYHANGTYEDERDLLLFFRDRELECRKAIIALTWQEMRLLPGATNAAPFQSKHGSAMQSQLNTRQLALSFHLGGKSLLGRAAETEARRRLVVVAIGLERYRVAHGSYPKDLQSLVPGILKSVPVDFMDGKPLWYRFSDPGCFVLHS